MAAGEEQMIKLRYVIRDGEKVLQQRVDNDDFPPLQSVGGGIWMQKEPRELYKWVDVPIEEEE